MNQSSDYIEKVKQSFYRFVRSFLITYGLHSTLSVLLRIFSLLRSKPRNLLSLNQIFGEKNLIHRVEAVRYGLTLGCFTGGYDFAKATLIYLFRLFDGSSPEKLASFISGSFASLSILWLEPGSRRTIVLYLMVRAFQCAYNSCKKRGWFHFWGSSWNYGDSLLYALSSAQAMYAYVMRPETLPPGYYKFIVHSGPIPEQILQAVRTSQRGIPIDLVSVNSYISKFSPHTLLTDSLPLMIPCSALHPHTLNCSGQFWKTFKDTFMKSLPLYSTLTFVPLLTFNLPSLFKRPIKSLYSSISSVLRSTTFLASFCAFYMGIVCIWRKFAVVDHRSIYWIAGFLCSIAIFVEKKPKRSELALYVLPRALDSLYLQLVDRKLLPVLPHGQLLIFMGTMGSLMYFYDHESDTMAPLLKWVFDKFQKNE